MPGEQGPIPAGFWQRAAAWSLDAVPVAVLSLLATWPVLRRAAARLTIEGDPVLRMLAEAMADTLRGHASGGVGLAGLPLALLPAAVQGAEALSALVWSLLWPPLLAFALLTMLWHGLFEASSWQASPGKRLLQLQVAGPGGARLGIARALLRQLAGALSWLTLNLGHAMVLAGPEHKALHDRLAGTRVFARRQGVPGWARVWLVLATFASFVATAALAGGLLNRLQALLDQALWY